MVCLSLRLRGYTTLVFPTDGKTKAQAEQTTVPWPGGSLSLKPSCSSKWLPSSCCFPSAPMALPRAAALQGRQERVSEGPCATDSILAWVLHGDGSPTHRKHSLDLHPPGLGKVPILTVGQSSGEGAWQTLPDCNPREEPFTSLDIWILVESMPSCLRSMKMSDGKVAVCGF